jgi:hypothetical protein
MAAGDKYRAARTSLYGSAAQVRDLLAKLVSGENPDGTSYTPPLLENYTPGGGGGTVVDATSTVKGVVQLAGDLGGTAGAPTVPGLAGKAALSHTHAQADVTGLTTALSGKQATLTGVADVPGLATALSAKQDAATAATDAELAAHTSASTAHGVDHTKTILAAVHNGTAYPARPSGGATVMWIGPTDPGASAQNGDTWIPTS